MIEDGTGIRHHAQAFGDAGTVIPPIILYRKAHITGNKMPSEVCGLTVKDSTLRSGCERR